MSIISAKTWRDRLRHVRTQVAGNLSGEMFLEPSNHYGNWRYDEIDPASPSNDPVGMEIGLPEEPEGSYIFMSEPFTGTNRGPVNLAAQNTVPVAEDSYWIDEAYSIGHSPKMQMEATTLLSPPPVPTVEIVPAGRVGWKAGVYKVSYTLMKGKRHTKLSPWVEVTLAAGQAMRVVFGDVEAEGATAIGIWVSKVGGGTRTMRLQKIVRLRSQRREVVLPGPWKRRKSPPSKNETRRGIPATPKLTTVPGFGPSVPGTYTAYVARIDEETGAETVVSEPSDPVEITEAEAARHVHLKLKWRRLRERFAGIGEDFTEDAGRYNVYIDYTPPSSTVTYSYELVPEGEGGTGKGFSMTDAAPVFSGQTEKSFEDTGKRQSKTNKTSSGASLREKRSTSASSASTSGDGGGGLEDPTTPLEGAFPQGAPYPAVGKYWIGVSNYKDGEETVATMYPSPVEITTTGQTIRVWLTGSVNVLQNPQWLDLEVAGTDLNEVPSGWLLTGIQATQGTLNWGDNGEMLLSTNGAKTGTALSPVLKGYFNVDRTQNYAVGGRFVFTKTAGNAVMELEEYDDAGAIVRTTPISTLTTSGDEDTCKRFGPLGTAFHDATVSARPVIRFDGATRHGDITVHEVFALKHDRKLRRVVPPALPGEHSDANPPADERWPKGAYKAIGLPPARSYTSQQSAPLDAQNFDTGALTGGWTRYVPTEDGIVSALTTGAKIEGTHGYNFQKNTSSTRRFYIWRDLGINYGQEAVRIKVRINSLPTNNYVSLVQLKNEQSEGNSGALARIAIDHRGVVVYSGVKPGGTINHYELMTGVAAGDTLDLELMVQGANTRDGYVSASAGRYGGTRSYAEARGRYDWRGMFPRYVQAGPAHFHSTGARIAFDVDTIVVTETGDKGAAPASPPELSPYPLPDRLPETVTPLETVTFEGGTNPWTPVTSNGGTIAVNTTSVIEGVYGLRVTTTDAAQLQTAYIQSTLGTAAESRGFKARIRVVARPTTGNVRLMSIVGESSKILGYFYLDSVGDLYAQTLTQAGTLLSPRKVASGITNTTILTLEMVADSAGTSTGAMTYWVEVNGTGGVSARKLMHVDTSVDWAGAKVSQLRVGNILESAAGVTATLDVDAIAVTTRGQVSYVESSQGEDIYQGYLYLPVGTLPSDEYGPKNWREAVEPGKTYTASVDLRYAMVPAESESGVVARPFSLYAYDINGEEYPLGSILGDSGISGTSEHASYTRSYSIPTVYDENDELIGCFEVRMKSPGLSSGEFVWQRFAWSPGSVAIKDVSYPTTGSFHAQYDTLTPHRHPAQNVTGKWLDLDAVADVPANTTLAAEYVSTATDAALPPGTVWSSDPSTVPQRRFAHIRINMTSDGTATPVVPPGSPFVDAYSVLAGQQVATLLREDGSEFPGGVYAFDFTGSDVRKLSAWDDRRPKGRWRSHRAYDPVDEIAGFTLRAFDLEAMTEIEEHSRHPFILEMRGKRYKIRFGEDVKFAWDEYSPKHANGRYIGVAEAGIEGPVDVLSTALMKGLS